MKPKRRSPYDPTTMADRIKKAHALVMQGGSLYEAAAVMGKTKEDVDSIMRIKEQPMRRTGSGSVQ